MYFCTAPYFKLSGHPASSNVDEIHNNVPDSSNQETFSFITPIFRQTCLYRYNIWKEFARSKIKFIFKGYCWQEGAEIIGCDKSPPLNTGGDVDLSHHLPKL